VISGVNLQSAYDGGNTISTTGVLPVAISALTGSALSVQALGNNNAAFFSGTTTTLNVANIFGNSLTDGSALYVHSNSADVSVRDVVQIDNTNVLATGATVLKLIQAAPGTNLALNGTGSYDYAKFVNDLDSPLGIGVVTDFKGHVIFSSATTGVGLIGRGTQAALPVNAMILKTLVGDLASFIGLIDSNNDDVVNINSLAGFQLGSGSIDTATGRAIRIYEGDGVGGVRFQADGTTGSLTLFDNDAYTFGTHGKIVSQVATGTGPRAGILFENTNQIAASNGGGSPGIGPFWFANGTNNVITGIHQDTNTNGVGINSYGYNVVVPSNFTGANDLVNVAVDFNPLIPNYGFYALGEYLTSAGMFVHINSGGIGNRHITLGSASVDGNDGDTSPIRVLIGGQHTEIHKKAADNFPTLELNNEGANATDILGSDSTWNMSTSGNLTVPTTVSSATGVILKGANRFIHNFNLAGTDGFNTFVGINSGNFTLTGSTVSQGSYNSALGQNTLTALTTGLRNIAIGYNSLASLTTGQQNTAVGNEAMFTNLTGNSNTAVGSGALYTSTGSSNTAFGSSALTANSTGATNTAVGNAALVSNSTGNNNVAMGEAASNQNTTGSNNTAIGYRTGRNVSPSLTTMSGTTFLGANANSTANGVSNSTALGSEAQVTKSDQVVIGNISVTETLLNGNVGIGLTAPADKLSVSNLSNLAGSGRAFSSIRTKQGPPGDMAANYFEMNDGTASAQDTVGQFVFNQTVGKTGGTSVGTKISMTGNASDTGGFYYGLYIPGFTQADADPDKRAVYIDNSNWKNGAITIDVPGTTQGTTGNSVFSINANNVSQTGTLMYVTSAAGAAATAPMAYFDATTAALDQPVVKIGNAGTDDALQISSTGTSGIEVTHSQDGIQIIGTQAIDMSLRVSANSLTTGRLATFSSTSADTSIRSLMTIDNLSALATGTTVVKITNASTGSALEVNGKTVLNEGGGDFDTRIEGDTDLNLIFVDASTDRVGIGTSTPDEKLDIEGHVAITGTDPVVSACGTGPAITGADGAGKVTIGTGVTTSCTVTFATAYTSAPACTITSNDNATTYGASTTAAVLTITTAADMASDVIMYNCVGL
jgi:hypothetical protein